MPDNGLPPTQPAPAATAAHSAEAAQPAAASKPLHLTPIGFVRSAYGKPSQAPRQPGVDDRREEALIELAPGMNFEPALEDLAGFDRIWVIAWFDRVDTWKPKVRPPRGSAKRSVFATRSPHRPNPIGLSVARLIGIEGLKLRIAETDLLDGTPVLDLKPYIPAIDSFAESRTGWLEQLPPPLTVQWSALAREQAEWLRAQGVDVVGTAERVLALGIEGQPRYKRVMLKPGSETTGDLAVESWRVGFRLKPDGLGIEVTQIGSGYGRAALDRSAAGEISPLHQDAVHRAFWQRWPRDDV